MLAEYSYDTWELQAKENLQEILWLCEWALKHLPQEAFEEKDGGSDE
jgi:hypothetical protein